MSHICIRPQERLKDTLGGNDNLSEMRLENQQTVINRPGRTIMMRMERLIDGGFRQTHLFLAEGRTIRTPRIHRTERWSSPLDGIL